jgi:hypothetical protein
MPSRTWDEPVDKIEKRAVGHMRELRTARTITGWLDKAFLDPILGFLIPGAGDILTGVTGIYLVVLALRMRLPKIVAARMLVNLAVDTVVGWFPIIGDLFDVWFRANERNLALIERRGTLPTRRGAAGDWIYVAGAGLLFVAALMLPILAIVWALRTAF